MIQIPNRRPRLAFITVALALNLAASASAQHGAETASAAFQRENEVAMERMMTGMAVAPSGNIDRDFAVMMIAHHQGAVDMALAQLRYGRDEALRRLAQEIVVAQQQEIAVMRLALGRLPGPATGPAAHGHGQASRH